MNIKEHFVRAEAGSRAGSRTVCCVVKNNCLPRLRMLLQNKMKEKKLIAVVVVVGGKVDIGAMCPRQQYVRVQAGFPEPGPRNRTMRRTGGVP